MSVVKWTSDIVQQHLYDTPSRLGPGMYVELGCYKGGSAICIAKGIQDSGVGALLITVDAFDGHALNPKYAGTFSIETVRASFDKEGVSSFIIPIQGLTADVAADYSNTEFNFLFIDADHEYAGCKADFEAWSPLVKSGGEIAFHDNDQQNVQRVLSEIPWSKVEVEKLTVFTKP